MGETIIPDSISNPIRTGFHPDPSICRLGEDYYLVTSSFTWFPGLPIYHSRDLTNWSLIGHALTNPKAIDFNGMTDNDGIWPPLCVIIMEHSILSPQLMAVVAISTWQPRIRPSLVGSGVAERCSRHWPFSFFWWGRTLLLYRQSLDFKSAWPAQCAVWMQELDLQKKMSGRRTKNIGLWPCG